MLNYLDTLAALHTRGLNVSLKEYLFVEQVVFKEDIRVAYASVFDAQEFVRNVPSEDEEEYLNKFKHDAENLLEKQDCKHLKEYLEQELKSYVQDEASTLQDYKFTGSDVQKLLSNLLKNRSEDLDDASVKDILSLIKSMYDSGALDSGDSFQQHFIQIHDKFNALCPNCNHEIDVFAGVDCVCPYCKQAFKWSEEERRFYPQPQKL
jgi:hypothetical protein